MFTMWKIIICISVALLGLASANQKVYKMCVPQKYHDDCVKLTREPSQAGNQMECVSGRDRMDCLEKVNKNEADVIAVDPEDMYVAYHINNNHFQVVSEIRTQVEKDAEFRYEGVILIKKSSTINKLQDLKGLKSCHTGFGRNVGYKIPITKLKKNGVLKVPTDPELAPVERELRALSEFFSQSCLVGTYSPNPEVDLLYKKRYTSLCAICEKPDLCNYPDKYSGYDGAIRCLAEGQGDVAFTKTSFIKKYFGLLGKAGEADNPQDYEYLCEDGSRRPITGKPCSWAQRPWRGYISNTEDVKEGLDTLQKTIDTFYTHGMQSENKDAAKNLFVQPDMVLHTKETVEQPKEFLERAGYKDVIERDGSLTQKVRLCITSDIELEKCQVLKRAAYSRDVRPEFECVQKPRQDCLTAIQQNEADAIVLTGLEYKQGRSHQLKPVVYESYGDDVYVAIVDSNINSETVQKAALKYDKENRRAQNAANFLNHKRGKTSCDEYTQEGQVEIINSRDLKNYHDKELICQDFQKKPVSEYKTCNFEATIPNAVFVREGMTNQETRNLIHAFSSISDTFSPKGKLEDVFELFGVFKDGYKNVIFTDDAVELSTEIHPVNEIDENVVEQLKCN